ncbi:19290_t:CDS:2, partial [Gigaspora margarita]
TISDFQQALRNINTDKSKNVWMSLFMKFCKLCNYLNEIIDLDNKTLINQLEQFIVEVRKSNGQEYKALSLYTRFCTLVTLNGHMKLLVNNDNKNRKQSSLLKIDEIKFILNSPAVAVDNPKGLMQRVWIWLTLLYCLRDGDTKRLKAFWLKKLDDDSIRLKKLKEKNHTRRIKDLYTESGNIADIRKYLSKCPNNAADDYFFVGINTPKKVYHGDWYLISKLEKGLHNTMMHSICKDAKLDFKGHCITNHSMRSTGIHNLVELGVTLDEHMIFS